MRAFDRARLQAACALAKSLPDDGLVDLVTARVDDDTGEPHAGETQAACAVCAAPVWVHPNDARTAAASARRRATRGQKPQEVRITCWKCFCDEVEHKVPATAVLTAWTRARLHQEGRGTYDA